MAHLPYQGLPQNTAEDRERARELYKYFRPPLAGEPLDTVLTAHAQLVAWRLDAERAMVSLIDENDQYFVAESTKTSHLDDAELHEKPGDGIWAGVGASFVISRTAKNDFVANSLRSVSRSPKLAGFASTQLPRIHRQRVARRYLKSLTSARTVASTNSTSSQGHPPSGLIPAYHCAPAEALTLVPFTFWTAESGLL